MNDNHFNLFCCMLCDDRPEMTPAEFAAHLKAVHGYTDTTGQKRFTGHIDAADWHQTNWNWFKDGVLIAYQGERYPRRGGDQAYWSGSATRKKNKKGGKR